MFHIIRAFHVAGRCTDCGECSRVCPQGIPLHLFNRKFIKEINTLYGDYQAGLDLDSPAPLTSFTSGRCRTRRRKGVRAMYRMQNPGTGGTLCRHGGEKRPVSAGKGMPERPILPCGSRMRTWISAP